MDEKEKRMKAFGEYLTGLRKAKDVSVRQVAEATQMSDPYLYQVENGIKSLTSPDWFKRLADYYGVPVEELLKKAGYMDETDEDKKIDEAFAKIVTDHSFDLGTRFSGKLNKEEKKFIIGLYEKAKKVKLL